MSEAEIFFFLQNAQLALAAAQPGVEEAEKKVRAECYVFCVCLFVLCV